eukprot:TCONS_00039327-protein
MTKINFFNIFFLTVKGGICTDLVIFPLYTFPTRAPNDQTLNMIFQSSSQTLLGEGCASILTSVYTQQTKWFVKGFTKDVITTDLKGSCTINSGGSSTAAAMVSAIVALALSVNQQLTWRDVQYLIIKSSNQNNLPVTWYTNGVGLRFNSRYGFGILDAGKMVTLSKTWKTTGVNMVSQKVLVTKSMVLTSLKKNELI